MPPTFLCKNKCLQNAYKMLTDETSNKYSIDCVTLNAPDTSDHEFVTDVDTIGIKEKKQLWEGVWTQTVVTSTQKEL